MLGLDGRGVELDPRYCDVIIRRFAELTGQEARLDSLATHSVLKVLG